QLLNAPGTVDRAKIEVRIRKVLKKLRLKNTLAYKGLVDGLIVIGNGTPDDAVVTVIAHLLDGRCNAGLLIPTEKGFGAVKHVVHVMRTFSGKPVAFVIDQEDMELEDLYRRITKKFSKFGVGLELSGGEGRWREFVIDSGSGGSKVIVVVNGLDGYEVHEIEDHLLALHGIGPEELPTGAKGDHEENNRGR
ncbi:MAG: hypothetical protein J7L91_05415, partial [Candidatus Korarchaeota archaeon]|nr:hypothetical protein [Candidatus Korarchaeota archaeon]